MRHSLTLLNKRTGLPITSGYTVKAYNYSATSTSAFSGSAAYTYTNNSDGTYSASITTTFKATIVLFSSGGSQLEVRDNVKGILLQGDNQPTIQPT